MRRKRAEGYAESVKDLPSPSKAERNQRRKLAYIPVWPILAALVIIVALAAAAAH
jgi:hypothetical protein